jgi:hypothetical protein
MVNNNSNKIIVAMDYLSMNVLFFCLYRCSFRPA